MRCERKGFTLVELLTVIAIIALLLSLALPALNEARMKAREVGDKASLRTINDAVENFAAEMGSYPNSRRNGILFPYAGNPDPASLVIPAAPPEARDQGAHVLFESLVGLDRIGYQKDSYYAVNPLTGKPCVYDAGNNPIDTERRSPFVNLESVTVGTMEKAHPDSTVFAGGANMNQVFMDTLDVSKPRPILYYKARTNRYLLDEIYDINDNFGITNDVDSSTGLPYHEKFHDNPPGFYEFIWDRKTGIPAGGTSADAIFTDPSARPHKADTFLLINAGRDHEYGTTDDITNFK
jgi:prepilin-type N-terminal cleavage/methylation domain-containing protein